MRKTRITGNADMLRPGDNLFAELIDVEWTAEYIGRTPPNKNYPNGHLVETWRSEHLTVHVLHHENKETESVLVFAVGEGKYAVMALRTADQSEYEFVRTPESFLHTSRKVIIELVMQVVASQVDKDIVKE